MVLCRESFISLGHWLQNPIVSSETICFMLQPFALRCNVLPYAATVSLILQRFALRCNGLPYAATVCLILQRFALCCNVLPYAATLYLTLQRFTLRCNGFPYAATLCLTLQRFVIEISSCYNSKIIMCANHIIYVLCFIARLPSKTNRELLRYYIRVI
jgi:hypothetical protein